MNGKSDSLDFRRWRNMVSYLAGIGVETLYTLALACVGRPHPGRVLDPRQVARKAGSMLLRPRGTI